MAKSTGKVREFCQSGKVGTLAMPPPKSYEPQTDKLKPTIGDNSGPSNLKRTCPEPGTVNKFGILL